MKMVWFVDGNLKPVAKCSTVSPALFYLCIRSLWDFGLAVSGLIEVIVDRAKCKQLRMCDTRLVG